MDTGKVEYAPDYKSERPPLNVVFEIGMDRQRLAAERSRLERAVVEAAKAYGLANQAVEDHMKKCNEADSDPSDGWQLLRDMESKWEDLLLEAVKPLLEFESEHGLTK